MATRKKGLPAIAYAECIVCHHRVQRLASGHLAEHPKYSSRPSLGICPGSGAHVPPTPAPRPGPDEDIEK